jgi:hypothetical protein
MPQNLIEAQYFLPYSGLPMDGNAQEGGGILPVRRSARLLTQRPLFLIPCHFTNL